MPARCRLTTKRLRPTTATRPIRTSPTSTRCSHASAPVRRRRRFPRRPPTRLTRSASPMPPCRRRRSRSPPRRSPRPRRRLRHPAPMPAPIRPPSPRVRPTPGGRSGPRCSIRCWPSVAKRAKRAAQDDQNALLDAVRRHKGRPTAAQVLTPEIRPAHGRGSRVPRDAIDDAYGAGRGRGRRRGRTQPSDDLVGRSRGSDRLAAARAHRRRRSTPAKKATPADSSSASARAFASGRTSRSRRSLADALAMAWSRGVYDAVARRRGAAVDPARRGSLRRLRRQRARADGEGRAVPDRPAASARAPGLPVPARPVRFPQPPRSERAARDGPRRRVRDAAYRDLTSARVRVPPVRSRRRSFGLARLADRCRGRRSSSCC